MRSGAFELLRVSEFGGKQILPCLCLSRLGVVVVKQLPKQFEHPFGLARLHGDGCARSVVIPLLLWVDRLIVTVLWGCREEAPARAPLLQAVLPHVLGPLELIGSLLRFHSALLLRYLDLSWVHVRLLLAPVAPPALVPRIGHPVHLAAAQQLRQQVIHRREVGPQRSVKTASSKSAIIPVVPHVAPAVGTFDIFIWAETGC